MNNNDSHDMTGAIAIIGMAGRFPKAKNIETFWQNLVNGIETITIEPSSQPNKVNAAGILEDIEYFDANYFNYSPRDAEIMDPQQRMMLECAIEALEDAGYTADKYTGRIGVYLGSAMSTYLIFNLLSRQDLLNSLGVLQISNGNDSIATPLSYKLNLTGPSLDVSTTCSSSLVAVHQACRSLLSYESDIILAGGSSINVLQREGYIYQEGSILSPDGHCRPFDHNAKGTVEGSGLGLIVLKRLEDALQDHDHIHAIIKGSAVNNDGADKVGYTAPSVTGQANVIAEALNIADVSADSISYVEAHGTGTALGDPIEISALTKAFRASSTRKNYCAIGSVKANIGHLNTASGIAGLIKTVLALKHRIIPPSLNYQQGNPQINFADSPFVVNTTPRIWNSENHPRRAGVSSFGMGGTNAHIILQEAPQCNNENQKPFCIIPLSAKNETALNQVKIKVAEHLSLHHELNLTDVAYTLQVGRKDHEYRCVIVAENIRETIDSLQSKNNKFALQNRIHEDVPKIVFMFPGQGVQYVNMALDIYQQESTFKTHVDHCCEILKLWEGLDLKEIIFSSNQNDTHATELLNQTSITQPALFIIEYALAKLLQEKGVNPHAMIGHSVGEYVAACLSGVFSLEEGLKLITMRGKLIQSLPSGKMLAVRLSIHEIKQHDILDCSIAAINAKQLCVLSGTEMSIHTLQEQLTNKGISVKILHTSHAFHSAMLDPILDEFAKCFQGISLNDPAIPYISNVTGCWVTADQAKNPDYWVQHLRKTVKFYDGIQTLKENDQNYVLLEVGPGQTLSDLARKTINTTVSTLPRPKESLSSKRTFYEAIAKLWLYGIDINWDTLYDSTKPHRVSLPTYAFQREYYWIERAKQESQKTVNEAFVTKKTIDKWFYSPSWKRKILLPIKDINLDLHTKWLVFDYKYNELTNAAYVKVAQSYNEISKDTFSINPLNHKDYQRLFDDTETTNANSINIIINLNVFSDNTRFYAILCLFQSLIKAKIKQPIRMVFFTSHALKVDGTEVINPSYSMMQGLIQAFSHEYPHIKCTYIDLPIASMIPEKQYSIIKNELLLDLPDPIVAIRGNIRWTPYFDQINLTDHSSTILKTQGVYLITGGLGNLGLIIANSLAQKYKAKLILVNRSSFPKSSDWNEYLQNHQDVISEKIKTLKSMQEHGAEILILSADISDNTQMQQVYQDSIEKFGIINGIIHAAGEMSPESFTTIDNLTIHTCENQFKPKVDGLTAIASILKEHQLDFCCLFSSISSQLNGLGHAGYSAANLYMDAFVQLHDANYHGTPLISLNWDAWFHGREVVDELSSNHQDIARLAISPAEGVQAFFYALELSSFGQIIISTTDLNQRIDRWISHDIVHIEVEDTLHDRPNLSTPYVEPRDAIEKQLTSIWVPLLGIEKIGIHDNFFELGGHSLLATQLTSRVRDMFNIEFSLQTLFKSPTIAGIANEILVKKTDDIDTDTLEKLLSEINN